MREVKDLKQGPEETEIRLVVWAKVLPPDWCRSLCLCLAVHAACRTHGRQGASQEAGRRCEELQELQTRFSPGQRSSCQQQP